MYHIAHASRSNVLVSLSMHVRNLRLGVSTPRRKSTVGLGKRNRTTDPEPEPSKRQRVDSTTADQPPPTTTTTTTSSAKKTLVLTTPSAVKPAAEVAGTDAMLVAAPTETAPTDSSDIRSLLMRMPPPKSRQLHGTVVDIDDQPYSQSPPHVANATPPPAATDSSQPPPPPPAAAAPPHPLDLDEPLAFPIECNPYEQWLAMYPRPPPRAFPSALWTLPSLQQAFALATPLKCRASSKVCLSLPPPPPLPPAEPTAHTAQQPQASLESIKKAARAGFRARVQRSLSLLKGLAAASAAPLYDDPVPQPSPSASQESPQLTPSFEPLPLEFELDAATAAPAPDDVPQAPRRAGSSLLHDRDYFDGVDDEMFIVLPTPSPIAPVPPDDVAGEGADHLGRLSPADAMLHSSPPFAPLPDSFCANVAAAEAVSKPPSSQPITLQVLEDSSDDGGDDDDVPVATPVAELHRCPFCELQLSKAALRVHVDEDHRTLRLVCRILSHSFLLACLLLTYSCRGRVLER